jgi:hypothetical protein
MAMNERTREALARAVLDLAVSKARRQNAGDTFDVEVPANMIPQGEVHSDELIGKSGISARDYGLEYIPVPGVHWKYRFRKLS